MINLFNKPQVIQKADNKLKITESGQLAGILSKANLKLSNKISINLSDLNCQENNNSMTNLEKKANKQK